MAQSSDSDSAPAPGFGAARENSRSAPVPRPADSPQPKPGSSTPASGRSQQTRRRFKNPLPTPLPLDSTLPPAAKPKPTPEPERRITKLTRQRFDALRLVTGQVDEANLQVTDAVPENPDSRPIKIVDQVTQRRRPLSSMMVSMVFHLTLILILAFAMLPAPVVDPGIAIDAVMQADPLEQDLVDRNVQETVSIELPDDNQSILENEADDLSQEADVKLAPAETTVPSPLANPLPEAMPQPEVPLIPEAAIPIRPTGGGLKGRDLEARAGLAASRGGSDASEAAVERALAWILEHQRSNGSWQLKHDLDACRGQCFNEGTMESTTAATGLALMSLLGAGYTHQSGPHQDEVQAGLEYLIKAMRHTRRGGSLMRGDRGMYSHAIATIALAEAYAMTEDTLLIGPIDDARKYIETAQHRKGGWRYNPGEAGDMTVTGWQLMALKSAQLGGFVTPDQVWLDAESFVNQLRESSGYFGYRKPSQHLTTTAVGALMKMYLGADIGSADVSTAADYVAGAGPSETDMYFNYYATQVLFHRGGKDWEQWNPRMRDYLISTQDQSGTHRTGSWFFRDQHGIVGGRLYTTAMAVMTLEVYYRYMPLYEQDAINDPVAPDPEQMP